MIELVRIVEDQTAALYAYRATRDEGRASQLEHAFENTKPALLYPEWHRLIATPFRYTSPLPLGRFRSPYGKNVFYGSMCGETALYEHAYHFMRERMHIDIDTGARTLFSVDADNRDAYDVRNHTHFPRIMDPHDYAASHHFIEENPGVNFVIFPSCRDPDQRENAAVLDIRYLDYHPKYETYIHFFYNNALKQITWIDYHLHISWEQVAGFSLS